MPNKNNVIEEWGWLVDLDIFTEIIDSLHHRKLFHSGFRRNMLEAEGCCEDNQDDTLDAPTSSKAVKKFHSAYVGVCCYLFYSI